MVSSGTVIQDANDASTGSKLRLRNGTFDVSEKLICDKIWLGAGIDKTIIQLDAPAQAIVECLRYGVLRDLTLKGISETAAFNSEPIAALLLNGKAPSTLLTATASSGQKTLPVADSRDFTIGETVTIRDSAASENRIIDTIPSDTIITVTVNLTNSYTVARAGSVYAGSKGPVSGNYQNINVQYCAVGVQLEDQTWDNEFNCIKGWHVPKLFFGRNRNIPSWSYAGENARLKDCWNTYEEGVWTPDYGFHFKVTNALEMYRCQTLAPIYDGILIEKSLGDGWDSFVGNMMDNCGRYGIRIGTAGYGGGFVDLSNNWMKGGLIDANGCALKAIDTHSLTIIGGKYITMPNDGAGTHHVLDLDACYYPRVIGSNLIGHPNTVGDAIRLNACFYGSFFGFNARDIIYALQETGGSNYNDVVNVQYSGIDYPANPVVLTGLQSGYDYVDITSSEKTRKISGKLVTAGIIEILGNALRMSASKNALVYEPGSNVLNVGWGAEFSGIELKAAYIKATGGYLIGAHASADATPGTDIVFTVLAGDGVTVKTITIKNGITTSVA